MTRITVRPADLKADRELLIRTLSEYLTPLCGSRRFDWLYSDCPFGRTRAWLAVDEAKNSVIGAAAAFPRRFYLGGIESIGWVLGDFCLASQYRSLGPALQLQRACLGVLEQKDSEFCYDFPSASMVAVYKRLGFSETGVMLRLAKPLRVDRKVKQMITTLPAQRVIASVGNALLKFCSPEADADQSLEISAYQGHCGGEFTALEIEQRRGNCGIWFQRSAGYLNWRYVDNPLAHYEFVTARRKGRLVGYAVWTQKEEDASIVDLFGEDDPGMMRRLIAEVVGLVHNRGLMTVSVSVNESHPWISLFSEMGFRLRESSPVAVIPSKSFTEKIDSKLTGWYLMQGDRDS